MLELVGVAIIVSAIAVGTWAFGRLHGHIEVLIREVREAHKRTTDEIHRLDKRSDDIIEKVAELRVITGGRSKP